MTADMTTLPSDLSRDDLRSIARRQKALIISLTIYIVLLLASLLAPAGVLTVIQILIGGVIIVATVLIFLLATRLYGVPFGILLGLLTLLPLIGIVVLLIVNARAIAVLRAAGLKVGFFGVKQPVE